MRKGGSIQKDGKMLNSNSNISDICIGFFFFIFEQKKDQKKWDGCKFSVWTPILRNLRAKWNFEKVSNSLDKFLNKKLNIR